MIFKFLKEGNICSPSGFLSSSLHCGLKKSGKADLCVLFSETPALVVGAFTSNKFCAAPVEVTKKIIERSSRVRAIVVNSGNANACTGKDGIKNAVSMTEIAAKHLGVSPWEVLVCSTGRIGVQMPMDKISNGISKACSGLSKEKGSDAAGAIMTTDLVKKECAVSFRTSDGKRITIASMTKGSGMIAPKMKTAHPHATMLSFITTDAKIDKARLWEIFDSCVSRTFNMISVDGDMSTNDSVILLANGDAGNKTIKGKSPDAGKFSEALYAVMTKMAKNIVLDGEGATKFITIEVSGAKTYSDAELCARAISNSMLCKTAWFGGDPNWGRVLAAAGYSGAQFDQSNVSMKYNDVPVITKGLPIGTSEEKLAKEVSKKELVVRINLGAGSAKCAMWTCDLSYEYVKINADYRT